LKNEKTKRVLGGLGRENLILVGPFRLARDRSSIVIVLELDLVLGWIEVFPEQDASN
jgi:hypothetical protein